MTLVSFGIHVARMAGIPKSFVKRAEEILAELEKTSNGQGLCKPVREIASGREGMQMSFFQLEDGMVCDIRKRFRPIPVIDEQEKEAFRKACYERIDPFLKLGCRIKIYNFWVFTGIFYNFSPGKKSEIISEKITCLEDYKILII